MMVSTNMWLLLWTFLAVIGATTYFNYYDERIAVEQQRIEMEQSAEERERCELALRVQYEQHAFPFDQVGNNIWIRPAECQNVSGTEVISK